MAKAAVRKAATSPQENVAIISTSDRNVFRMCRRKWNWSSHLRQSWHPMSQRRPLWFGSCGHHVLEDLHGHRLYKTTDDAVDDYVQATLKQYGVENLPDTWESDTELLKRILQHYKVGWLQMRKRDPLKTYVVKGEPQVEVPFEFVMPIPKPLLKASGFSKVIYRGTMDRVLVDEDGYLWIQDYKFVTAFTNTEHLELDSQIGVYMWAASYIYRRPVLGFVYTQFKKVGVEPPRVLQKGLLSTDKSQSTTHGLYRAKLRELHGETGWPEKNVECLNFLASTEEEEADKFIRRDRVTRSMETMQAEADKIIAEVSDMLDPDLRIYPNPSQLYCTRMCSFMEPCLQMDRGEHYRSTLQTEFAVRSYEDRNEWRRYLKVGNKEDKPHIEVDGTDQYTMKKLSKQGQSRGRG